jgi:hypothetical protein
MVFPNISEEHITSIFRAEETSKMRVSWLAYSLILKMEIFSSKT